MYGVGDSRSQEREGRRQARPRDRQPGSFQSLQSRHSQAPPSIVAGSGLMEHKWDAPQR